MLSVEIIKRSFFGIANNLDVAWKVSGFWWVILTIMTLPLAIQVDVLDAQIGETTVSFAESLGPVILIYSVFYIGFAVVGLGVTAIGWHRFLINDERPSEMLFLKQGWPWGQYFWAGLLLTLIATIVLIVPSIYYYLDPKSYGDASLGFSAIGFNLIIQIAATLPFTYLGLTLPAIAVDTQKSPARRIRFSESWQLTRQYGKELLMLVLITSMAYAIITAICEQIFGDGTISAFDPAEIAGFLTGAAITWVISLFGIGLLSELYKEIVPEGWRYQKQGYP